jgi:hypothetical protein
MVRVVMCPSGVMPGMMPVVDTEVAMSHRMISRPVPAPMRDGPMHVPAMCVCVCMVPVSAMPVGSMSCVSMPAVSAAGKDRDLIGLQQADDSRQSQQTHKLHDFRPLD